ncbi:hypothetical protein HPB50_011500 [Hyalomma asiaticum]|uniref:Uncharacterized protein n=1 Tax=Hyalomma asiaticum TaxID=266040 RepID=A0ACB7RW40_HYAAI|nr:hypothetical protein HPB50_011500 [Hyalomma asiaticum]
MLPHLPPEVLTVIFRYLDVESLLNAAEAVPTWKRLALYPTVVRTVTVDLETGAPVVKKFLRETREEPVQGGRTEKRPLSSHVRELCFTNCIALRSEVILGCARQCRNLRELYCVNCSVEADQLFVLLSNRLTCLTRLEWTLRVKTYEATWAVWRFVERSNTEGPRITAMYVELVVDEWTESFLNCFVSHCRRLRHLHIHEVRGKSVYVYGFRPASSSRAFIPSKDGPAKIIDRIPSLETFKHTYEMKSLDWCATWLPVINNFTWQREPDTCFGTVRLGDLVEGNASLRRVEQAKIVLQGKSQASGLLEEAAAKPDLWKDVSRLALILTSDEEDENPSRPRVSCFHAKPLVQFFEKCVPHLTELDLSSCHFATRCDCCFIVSTTVRHLRSLALPRCGANHRNSLKHLAHGCKHLERLEVRLNCTEYFYTVCQACLVPPSFTRSDFELLHGETRLKQLGIDGTADIRNLRFLRQCRVAELRLCVDRLDNKELAQCSMKLGQYLAVNPNLSSLTLVASDVVLCRRVGEALAQIQSLRHLCVLTAKPNNVGQFFSALASRLPGLRTAHVHCLYPSDGICAFTWIRQWQSDRPVKPPVHFWTLAEGVVLQESHCFQRLCSLNSFIGLVRPRNRF